MQMGNIFKILRKRDLIQTYPYVTKSQRQVIMYELAKIQEILFPRAFSKTLLDNTLQITNIVGVTPT